MADPQSTRPSLQPRAQDIQTWFPNTSVVNEGSLNRAPAAARELADALGTRASKLQQENQSAAQLARKFVEQNPQATEKQIIDAIGGYRNVARGILSEQSGRSQGEDQNSDIRRRWKQHPNRRKGPEFAKQFVDEEIAKYYDESEGEDENYRTGLIDSANELRASLISEAVVEEEENIIQQRVDSLGKTVRDGLDGGKHIVVVVESLKKMIADGALVGLDGPEMNSAIISEFATFARDPAQLGEGEDFMRALVEGEDPLITDPEDRNRVMGIIGAIQNDDVSERSSRASAEKAAKKAAGLRGEYLAAREIRSGGTISQEAMQQLDYGYGEAKASEVIASLTRNREAVVTGTSAPRAMIDQLKLMARNGDLSSSLIDGLDIPDPTKDMLSDLLPESSTIQSGSVYKRAETLLKMRLSDATTGLPSSPTQTADLITALQYEAQALIEEDPSLKTVGRSGDLAMKLDAITSQLMKSAGPTAEPSAGVAAGIARESLKSVREIRRAQLEQLIETFITPKPPPAPPRVTGATGTVLGHHSIGVDPMLLEIWAGADDEIKNNILGASSPEQAEYLLSLEN